MSDPAPVTLVGNGATARTRTPQVPPVIRRSHRRRRPSGAPPPLPRHIGTTGKGWLVATSALLGWVVVAYVSQDVRRVTDQADAALLRRIVTLRTPWLTTVLNGVHGLISGWWPSLVALCLVVALVVLRRWRHLFTFLGSVLVVEMVALATYRVFERPRPYDVTTIGWWAGFSLPSPSILLTTLFTVAIVYTLVVPGRARTIAKLIGAGVVGVFVFAELYLGVSHPFDLLMTVTFAVGVEVNAFRFFTPNEVFPVAYRRGKTAHLDVGGRRGEALRRAVEDQLGLTVVDIKPVGLAGSGGSTPLRLQVVGDPDSYLFGKLYAMSHVRADRLYKLGRTILYGGLEDEAPFQSVRRLVTYEDYALRLLDDIGVPTAAAHGVVELTPEREYLLVTEFFDGAQEIGDAAVDDDIIDQGLVIIRQLWDAGLAHRDIKPANLLVKDGRLVLIDPAFVQVRPSPWRQAVDLANMLLVLAVRTDADRVYRRALAYFTDDEIAEALAAARGIASPSQLRAALKKDGRDLVAQFRALAPPLPPIKLQRWNIKRVLLVGALLLGAQIVIPTTIGILSPGNDLPLAAPPSCGTNNAMILMAQAVPTAMSLPCVRSLPAGWELGGADVRRGRARLWLDSDRAGNRAVEVTLLPSGRCGPTDPSSEVPSDEVGEQRFDIPDPAGKPRTSTRAYVSPGGCVTYRFAPAAARDWALVGEAEQALSFQFRVPVVMEVWKRTGQLHLCGAIAQCPGG